MNADILFFFNDHMDALPLYERMAALGMEVSCTMLEDGHAFPVHRIALTNLVFDKIRDILESNS